MSSWPKPRKNKEKAKENTLAFLLNSVHGLLHRWGEAADPPRAIQPDLTVQRELLTQTLSGSQQTRLGCGKGQAVSGGIIRLLHAIQITVSENIPISLSKLLQHSGQTARQGSDRIELTLLHGQLVKEWQQRA